MTLSYVCRLPTAGSFSFLPLFLDPFPYASDYVFWSSKGAATAWILGLGACTVGGVKIGSSRALDTREACISSTRAAAACVAASAAAVALAADLVAAVAFSANSLAAVIITAAPLRRDDYSGCSGPLALFVSRISSNKIS